jgi:hypothetical protein
VWYADQKEGDEYVARTYCWGGGPEKSWLRRFFPDEYVRVIHGVEFSDEDIEIPDSLLVEISQLPDLRFMVVNPRFTRQPGFQRIRDAFPLLRIMLPQPSFEESAESEDEVTDRETKPETHNPFGSSPGPDPFAPDNSLQAEPNVGPERR